MASAETKTTQQRLMRDRARALATILLTRREGVTIQDVEGDTGLFLVATLPPTEVPGLRQLGVVLRYVLEPVTAGHADKVLQPFWPVPGYGPYPIPVVLFFFTMKDNGAWYAWVAEPVVADDGKLQLPPPPRDKPDCHPLTDETLEELLDRVDAWYDAHYEGLAVAVPNGRRGKKS